MIIPELNQALVNLETEDDYERDIIFRQLYRAIYRNGMFCFDKEGRANNMDGEMIIQRVIKYFAEKKLDEKCWWMRRYLLLYQKRFRGAEEQQGQPGSAEFVYLPVPTHRLTLMAGW